MYNANWQNNAECWYSLSQSAQEMNSSPLTQKLGISSETVHRILR